MNIREEPVQQSRKFPAQEAGFNTAPSGIEKEVLDELIKIASANSVTLDWLIMRALRVCFDDFRKTVNQDFYVYEIWYHYSLKRKAG